MLDLLAYSLHFLRMCERFKHLILIRLCRKYNSIGGDFTKKKSFLVILVHDAFGAEKIIHVSVFIKYHYIFGDKLLHFKRYSSGMRGGGACILSSFIPYH
mgnify:CR=1 FL=1